MHKEQQNKSNIWPEVNKEYLEEWYVRGQDGELRKVVSCTAIQV